MTLIIYEGHVYMVVYSPDDGGFYGEISNQEGEQLHLTDVTLTPEGAAVKARRWIREYADETRRISGIVTGK